MRKLGWLTIGVVICASLLGQAIAQSTPDWKKELGSKDAAVRDAAIDALKQVEGAERDEGLTELRELQAKAATDYAKAVAKVRTAIKGYDKEDGEEKVQRTIDAWLKIRNDAWDAIMDEQIFPHPGMGAVNGPHTGYDIVTPKFQRAQNAYKSIAGMFGGTIKKALSGSLGKVLAKVDLLEEHAAALTAALVDLGDDVTFEPANLNIFRALDLLAHEKYADAAKLYGSGGLNNVEKTAYFFVLAEAINMWNARNPGGHSKGETGGLKMLNDLRISMGVLPYEVHPALVKAIKGHLQWCNANEMGHFGPTGAKTCMERAATAGYPSDQGHVSENLVSGGGFGGGVSTWKWDGGHFRNMLLPNYYQIGCGMSGGAGFNNAYGAPAAVARVTPPWKQ